MGHRTRGARWRLLEILADGTRRYLPRVFTSQEKARQARREYPPEAPIHAVRELAALGKSWRPQS